MGALSPRTTGTLTSINQVRDWALRWGCVCQQEPPLPGSHRTVPDFLPPSVLDKLELGLHGTPGGPLRGRRLPPSPGPQLTRPLQELHPEGVRVGVAAVQGSDGALPAARFPALEVLFQLPLEAGAGMGHPHEQRGRRAEARSHGCPLGDGAASCDDAAGPGQGRGASAPPPWGAKFQFLFPGDPSRLLAEPHPLLSSPPSWPQTAR